MDICVFKNHWISQISYVFFILLYPSTKALIRGMNFIQQLKFSLPVSLKTLLAYPEVEALKSNEVLKRQQQKFGGGCSSYWLTSLPKTCVFSIYLIRTLGFPVGARGKEPAQQCRRHKRHGFFPWAGKIPWRRKWQPTPVFLPGESHGQRRLAGYSPWGGKELDTEATSHERNRKIIMTCY